MAINHGSSAIDERGGSKSGRPRSFNCVKANCVEADCVEVNRADTRWIKRVIAFSLGATLASGSLASYAPRLAQAQTSGSSRSAARPGATTSPSAVRRADAAFKEGRALFDLGRYGEACEKFELSQQLDPSPGTLLNLGNCYEPQGDLLRALETFEQAFADAQRTSDPGRKELWAEAARERIASLSRRVPRIKVRNVPPDARLSLDQQLLDQRSPERTSGELRVNPGRHLVEVSAPGKGAFQHDFDIVPGQRLVIDVPALQADTMAHETDARGTPEQVDDALGHPRPEGTPRGDQYGPWPYVLGGAGAVLLGTSLVTGLAANARENKLENECSGTTCPLELEGTRDSARTLAAFADVFWITGLITAGVGVTLFVLDSQNDAPSTSVEAGCFGSGCGLVANGHF